jgi:hypothetical protein
MPLEQKQNGNNYANQPAYNFTREKTQNTNNNTKK